MNTPRHLSSEKRKPKYFCPKNITRHTGTVNSSVAVIPAVTTALRPAVWYTAPWGVVRRYCPDKGLWRRAAALRRRGRGRCHLLAPGEGPARQVWYWLRQGAYWRKVKNYG